MRRGGREASTPSVEPNQAGEAIQADGALAPAAGRDRAQGPWARAARHFGPVLRRLLPWLVAAGVLGYLCATTPADRVLAALARASSWQLLLATVAYITLLLLADSLALGRALREVLGPPGLPLAAVVEMRGASWLLATLHYGAGQGGIVYFLKRHYRVPVAAGTAAVLLASGALIVAIALAVGVGLLWGAAPDRPELSLWAVAVAISVAAYLGLVALRPRPLLQQRLLAPLFAAGVKGTLRVVAARLLHAAVLIAGHFVALRLFDVAVPPAVAFARLPIVFLVAALPIAPAGLGTAQAAAVSLFSDYAAETTPGDAHATVLAYSLSFHLLGTAVSTAIGFVCWRRLAGRASVLTATLKTP